MDINHVRGGINSRLPHVIQNHCSSDYASGITAQVFQKNEFLWSKAQGLTVSRSFPTDKVQLQIRDTKP